MYATHDDTFSTRTVAAPASPGVIERLAVGITTRLQRWKQIRADNEAFVALASMDAHLLRDIGADRGDLARLVREGRS